MKKQIDLRNEAFSRAIDLLTAAGALYGVVFDGKAYGVPLARNGNGNGNGNGHHTGRVGHSRRTRNDLSAYGYRDRVRGAKSGDLLVWEEVPNKLAQPLRSAATSAASSFFGSGASISTVTKQGRGHSRVEVLIVAGPKKEDAPAQAG